jgi:hypothetical protein
MHAKIDVIESEKISTFHLNLNRALVVTGPSQDQLKDPTHRRFCLSLWSSERCNGGNIFKKGGS